jgi:hypothetical protein
MYHLVDDAITTPMSVPRARFVFQRRHRITRVFVTPP